MTQRSPNESFEDYKERRSALNKAVKQHLKGKLVFDCGVHITPEGKLTKGTSYVKPKEVK